MKHPLLFPILLFTLMAGAQTWTTATDMTEPVRAGNTASYATADDGFMFVISGRNAAGLINKKNQRYQISTNTWTDMADHPTGRLGAASTTVKDSIYTIGGLVTTPGTLNRRVYKYSIHQNNWTQMAMLPQGLTDALAVTYQDSLIYVVGGYTGLTFLYNTHTNQWRYATPILPSGDLAWGGFAVKDNKLVYVCGTDGFLSPNYFNTVMVGTIDPNDRAVITWSEGTPFPGSTRTFFNAHAWKDGIIMTGGSTDNTFDTHSTECYHYNTNTDTWTQLPSKPTSWNTGNSASVLAGGEWKLICSAGYAGGYLTQTEIFTEADGLGIGENKSCSIRNFQITASEIVFCSAQDEPATATIHDLHGRIIQTVTVNGTKGENRLNIPNDSLPKGVYLCTLKQGQISASKKWLVN
ncbi:T9SS type A sorting domain-containing protein [Flavobacterium sp.]|uniref:T9SS type A sorting domain-containing protein n=1 Tax=Flavobacterium sp. TaxID=239 RepID=UPI0039E64E28